MRDESGQAVEPGAAPDSDEGAEGSLAELKPGGDAARGATGGRGEHPRGGQPDVASNYKYWREHGAGWAAEYDARKKDQVYYHIQEIMLTEYVRHHAPAKVLEFGCGPGRHLRNLSRLPGIDANGYDQSASMVSGARGWASQQWLDEHVTIGMPTGRLPFKDNEFDIAYTAEVLVHVRPEDLEGILRELVRVAKRQVFHLETSAQHRLVSDAHDGCWWHDLVAAYATIGLRCEPLVPGYEAHSPYRVVLDSSAPTWEWSPVFLDLTRRLERDVSGTIDHLRGSLQGEKNQRLSEAAQAEGRLGVLDAQRADLAEKLRQAEASRGEAVGSTQRLERELVEARAQCEIAQNRADAGNQARNDLAALVRSLEAELALARSRIAALERDMANLGQREADFIRAVERRSGRS